MNSLSGVRFWSAEKCPQAIRNLAGSESDLQQHTICPGARPIRFPVAKVPAPDQRIEPWAYWAFNLKIISTFFRQPIQRIREKKAPNLRNRPPYASKRHDLRKVQEELLKFRKSLEVAGGKRCHAI